MKKTSFALIALLSSAAAFAQAEPPTRDIVANPDPAKVTAVERHAQELRDKQGSDRKAPAPMAEGPKHKPMPPHKPPHKHPHKPGGPEADRMDPPNPDVAPPPPPPAPK